MRAESLLRMLEEESKRGEAIAVVRVIRTSGGPNKTLLLRDGEAVTGGVDDSIARSINSTLNGMISKRSEADLVDSADGDGNPVRIVIELVKDKLHLVVFGGGHVGQAVALMSAIAGYRVTVVDDREEFASRKRLPDPDIELLVSDYESASSKVDLGGNSAVVIVTRGHQYDEVSLRSVIRSQARYIGMIGSKRRVLSVFDRLQREGFAREELSRVHAPIGLKIGARSPQEIAVAILAEIISHVNNDGLDARGK